MSNNPFLDNKYGIDFDNPIPESDTDWLGKAFMVPMELIDPEVKSRFFRSFGDTIFGSTRLGVSRTFNPLPQFSLYTDPRSYTRLGDIGSETFDGAHIDAINENAIPSLQETKIDYGYGEYYSDTFLKNEQVLYIETGTPDFGSVFSVVNRVVDREALIMAAHGRSLFWYESGKFAGSFLLFRYYPLVWVTLTALSWAKDVLVGDRDNSYYTLKPDMHSFWGSVTGIWTEIATELGVVDLKLNKPDKEDEGKIGFSAAIDQNTLKAFAEYYPDLISKDEGTDNYYLDVYKLASGTYRNELAQIAMIKSLKKAAESSSDSEFKEKAEAIMAGLHKGIKSENNAPSTLMGFFTSVLGMKGLYGWDKTESKGNDPTKAVNKEGNKNEEPATGEDAEKLRTPDDTGAWAATKLEEAAAWMKESLQYAGIAKTGGGRYLPLRVEYAGSSEISFNNTTSTIDLENKFNQTSNRLRHFKFDAFGGNLLGDTVKEAAGVLTDVALGMAEGVTFGLSNVVAGALFGGMVTLPLAPDQSSVTLPTHRFKLHMTQVSGHPMAMLTSTYLIISALIALGAPRAVGRYSYYHPPLFRAFLKGEVNTKISLMSSLTIRSATGNLGKTSEGRPIAFEIEFEFIDMAEKPAAPVPKPRVGPIATSFDDGAVLSMYIRSIVGADLHRETSYLSSLKSRLARTLMAVDQVQSPSYVGSMLDDVTGFVSLSLKETLLR